MPKTVLFVCTGNYYRSRYAEYLFNARISGAAGWQADSRGLNPSPLNSGPINQDAAWRLARQGIAPAQFRDPQRLELADLERADLIIALHEGEHRPYVQQLFPEWEQRIHYWQVDDLWGMTPDQALALIEQQVLGLVEELGADAAQ